MDMECSAVAALAVYRGLSSAISSMQLTTSRKKKWDIRTLSSHEDLDSKKDRIAELAIQFALFWEKAN